jgi:hypothetical protein
MNHTKRKEDMLEIMPFPPHLPQAEFLFLVMFPESPGMLVYLVKPT